MISNINESKYFLGVTLLLLNIGSKHIAADVGDFHATILDNDLVKRFILFSLFFVALRDVVTSLALTLAFSFIVYGFFHEKSRFSFVPNKHAMNQRKDQYYERFVAQKPYNKKRI